MHQLSVSDFSLYLNHMASNHWSVLLLKIFLNLVRDFMTEIIIS